MSKWLTLSVPALGINPRFLAFGAFFFFFFLLACFLFCKCWLPLWHTDVPRDNPRSLTLLTQIQNLIPDHIKSQVFLYQKLPGGGSQCAGEVGTTELHMMEPPPKPLTGHEITVTHSLLCFVLTGTKRPLPPPFSTWQ